MPVTQNQGQGDWATDMKACAAFREGVQAQHRQAQGRFYLCAQTHRVCGRLDTVLRAGTELDEQLANLPRGLCSTLPQGNTFGLARNLMLMLLLVPA